MKKALFSNRLTAAASRLVSRTGNKAALSHRTLLVARNVTTKSSFQPRLLHNNLRKIRTFSTQFREDYDHWYSHGWTGIQTQLDDRTVYFGDDSNNDIITFGVEQTVYEVVDDFLENLDSEDEVEDLFVDYSEDEFDNWFKTKDISSIDDDTIVSVEKFTYEAGS